MKKIYLKFYSSSLKSQWIIGIKKIIYNFFARQVIRFLNEDFVSI